MLVVPINCFMILILFLVYNFKIMANKKSILSYKQCSKYKRLIILVAKRGLVFTVCNSPVTAIGIKLL